MVLIISKKKGCVRVWDPRQKSPVVSLEPIEKEPVLPDAWCVGYVLLSKLQIWQQLQQRRESNSCWLRQWRLKILRFETKLPFMGLKLEKRSLWTRVRPKRHYDEQACGYYFGGTIPRF